ncbi:hypothetical protein BJX68DRAFT_261739 [Aspergillus pseudodeflectus]|uniref:Zn(2)-C6 fungal-type domain-containing protein n=1 Tax=Aspergillus pseudodeflectus TaxID=176178 RepID=A0ABR4L423_9EURO
MVGVPGKSKGCNKCRRRKKGCDLQQPSCGQCRKSAIPCDGYSRATIWESYLPNGRAFQSHAGQYSGGVWLNNLPAFFRLDGPSALPLKNVLLAIALATFGKRDGKRWMVEASLRLHGESLAGLAGQLGDRGGLASDMSLATVRCLSLHEILHRHDLQDHVGQVRKWHMHTNGGLGFVLSRGPESYTSGFAHQVFADDRATQISTSLITRTRSPLNRHECKTIPWAFISKTPKDLLTDIFAEIPSLLADLDELRTAEDAYVKRETLIWKCWHLEKQWRAWRSKYEPQADPLIASPETVSPSQVFDSFLSAHIMGGYWTIGIFLYGIFHLAAGTAPDEIAKDETDPRRCCQKIIDIIPALLHPYSGEYGVHGGIFPVLIALMYLEEVDGDLDSSEACDIYALLDKCNRGRRILHFVENMRQRLKAGGVRLFGPVYS